MTSQGDATTVVVSTPDDFRKANIDGNTSKSESFVYSGSLPTKLSNTRNEGYAAAETATAAQLARFALACGLSTAPGPPVRQPSH
jgi:hypothetical protein